MKRCSLLKTQYVCPILMGLISYAAVAQIPNQVQKSEGDIRRSIKEAQAILKTIDETKESTSIDLFVAISKSMPKTSLERLARDAAQAQVPLVLQGVGTRPEKNTMGKTVLETYGRHWLARHMEDWAFVTQTGAVLQIDPTRFKAAGIVDVPQVIVMRHCENRGQCQQKPTWILRARGDVTLDYALEYLLANLPKEGLSENDAETVKAKLQKALARLRKEEAQ